MRILGLFEEAERSAMADTLRLLGKQVDEVAGGDAVVDSLGPGAFPMLTIDSGSNLGLYEKGARFGARAA